MLQTQVQDMEVSTNTHWDRTKEVSLGHGQHHTMAMQSPLQSGAVADGGPRSPGGRRTSLCHRLWISGNTAALRSWRGLSPEGECGRPPVATAVLLTWPPGPKVDPH